MDHPIKPLIVDEATKVTMEQYDYVLKRIQEQFHIKQPKFSQKGNETD